MTVMSESVINNYQGRERVPEGLRFKLPYDRKSASEQMSEDDMVRSNSVAEKDK
jgi:hypothetical protein